MRYVYLLKSGDSHYKVGIAKDVEKRLKTIQTSNPNPVEVITAKLIENETEAEDYLHRVLAEVKASGGQEWFALNFRQALFVAAQINKFPSVDLSYQADVLTLVKSQESNQRSIEEKLDFIFDVLQRSKNNQRSTATQAF